MVTASIWDAKIYDWRREEGGRWEKGGRRCMLTPNLTTLRGM